MEQEGRTGVFPSNIQSPRVQRFFMIWYEITPIHTLGIRAEKSKFKLVESLLKKFLEGLQYIYVLDI